MKKKAFITGINGQDGSYLSEYLLGLDYDVFGIVRRNSIAEHQESRIDHLVGNGVHTEYGDLLDVSSLERMIRTIKPDEIYNIAAQSHVRISMDIPQFTVQTNTIGLLNILEAYKNNYPKARFYQASSSEMFGDVLEAKQKESTPLNPQSPYAISKVFSHFLTQNYRNSYGLFATSGILFNHESPLRSKEFVTKKIVDTALKIKRNKNIILRLGNVEIVRDWGWAPDYVRAIWLMMQRNKPRDFIIGSGKTYSLKDFVNEVFKYLDISKKNLKTNVSKYKRKVDLRGYKANIADTQKILKWKPKLKFKTIIHKMINNELF